MTRCVLIVLALVAVGCGAARPLPTNACRPMEEGDDTRPWEHRSYSMEVPWFAPRRGAERPRVVIQEFSDFECPFCARANPAVEQVLEEYGDCVQVVWRNYPLRYHANAPLAARAAMEVYRQGGDDAFWQYHDLLFEHQEDLSRAELERLAATIDGVDVEELRRALDSGAHQSALDRDRGVIEAHGVRIGTPAFFVNGYLLSGARPVSWFRRAIDEALRDGIYGLGPPQEATAEADAEETAGGEAISDTAAEPPPEGVAVPMGPSDPPPAEEEPASAEPNEEGDAEPPTGSSEPGPSESAPAPAESAPAAENP